MTDAGGPFPRFDLAGRTALVTGAARGIGRTIALALANAGADVALGLRDSSTAVDVEQAIAELGRLDILVNNAGLGPANNAEDVTEADFDLTFDVNVKGTFFASQAAGRAMIHQRFGRIINLSSQAGFVALPTESVYCTTKAAIAHLTKCLAVEWGSYGITVNAVAPTFIRTPGTEGDLTDAEFHRDVVERIAALHRIGEPMDVAGAVVFLASPAADLITGTTLLIDGGWTAR